MFEVPLYYQKKLLIYHTAEATDGADESTGQTNRFSFVS